MLKRLSGFILMITPIAGIAQEWEVGVLGGITNYNGDLNHQFIVSEEINPGYSLFLRYNENPYFTVKSSISYGHVSASDEHAESEFRKERNLSFRSQILEFSVQGEWNIAGFKTTDKNLRTTPYLFGGLGVFGFKPKAKHNGEWVSLQPLGTEGQGSTKYNDREKYSVTQISIPLGIGLKHAFNKNWSIGLEAGFRKTFTDYIDDVSSTYVERKVLIATHGKLAGELADRSDEVTTEDPYSAGDQRGTVAGNDWYSFGGITLSYTIVPSQCYNFTK